MRINKFSLYYSLTKRSSWWCIQKEEKTKKEEKDKPKMSSSISMITMDEDRYEHVLESLGVISRLTENKRLTVRTGNIDIDNERKLQFFKRWWWKDDRDVCLAKVKQIFNEGIHMARSALHHIVVRPAVTATGETDVGNYLEKERSARKYGRLSEALEAASHGIATHKVTYKNDDRFCALVDVFVGHVRDQLNDMDMTLQMTMAATAPDSQLPPLPSPPSSASIYSGKSTYPQESQ